MPGGSIATRKVAVLVADGYDGPVTDAVVRQLEGAGAVCVPVAPVAGQVIPRDGGDGLGKAVSVLTDPSVLFDGVVVPGGDKAVEGLSADPDVLRFLAEAFRHGKAVGAVGAGIELLIAAGLDAVELAAEGAEPLVSHGVVTTRASGYVTPPFVEALAAALALHRSWDRPAPRHPG